MNTTPTPMLDEHSELCDHSEFNLPKLPPRKTLEAASELLRALSAPIRISIVTLLNQPRCVHELVTALDVAQPLVSQHLRILRASGVVVGERSGREVLYRLKDEHLAHIVSDSITHVSE